MYPTKTWLQTTIDAVRTAARMVGTAFAVGRELVVYTISAFWLFGVPYLLGKLIWTLEIGDDWFERVQFLLFFTGLWYLFLRVVAAPAWYIHWANMATALNNLLVLYERLTGQPVRWR